MYAAYKAATEHTGQPTVILAKTIKGWTLGSHFEGRNATHQMKKLTLDDLKGFRDRLYLDIPDAALDETLPPYYHPGEDSDEIAVHARAPPRARRLPARRRRVAVEAARAAGRPGATTCCKRGSGKQKVATTMAFVRLLKDLMKDKEIGTRFVPIIPDEARTFGMDSLFPTHEDLLPHGQHYTSVDRELMLSYKESETGQILHEGINEAGSIGVVHRGRHVVRHARRADDPDLHLLLDVRLPAHRRRVLGGRPTRWRAASCSAPPPAARRSTARACSTRTATRCCSRRPTRRWSPTTRRSRFEIGHIVQDGLRRMYGDDAGGRSSTTSPSTTSRIAQPAEPEDVDVEGILRGIYRYAAGAAGRRRRRRSCSPPASRCRGRCEAQRAARRATGASQADVWSVTSWNELRRDGRRRPTSTTSLHPERASRGCRTSPQRLHDAARARSSRCRTACARCRTRSRRGCRGDFTSLGTDGFGLSDTRAGAAPALPRRRRVDRRPHAGRAGRRGEVDRGGRPAGGREVPVHDVQAAPAEERSDPSPAT